MVKSEGLLKAAKLWRHHIRYGAMTSTVSELMSKYKWKAHRDIVESLLYESYLRGYNVKYANSYSQV